VAPILLPLLCFQYLYRRKVYVIKEVTDSLEYSEPFCQMVRSQFVFALILLHLVHQRLALVWKLSSLSNSYVTFSHVMSINSWVLWRSISWKPSLPHWFFFFLPCLQFLTWFLCVDWFHQCFIPKVRKYLASRDCLLIMDNNPGYPEPHEFDT